MTFVSITLMMMSPLEHVVIYRTISNVREKSDRVTYTLFDNVAFISNRIDDVIAEHAVTCCDLSQYVLEKPSIAVSNKAVDDCEIANVVFLLY